MRSTFKAGLFALLAVTCPLVAQAADPAAAAAPAAADAPKATTIPEGKAQHSYAIGAQVGTQLRRAKIDFDFDQFVSALKAALADEKLAMTDEEMNAALTKMNDDLTKKAEAERVESVTKNASEGKKFLEENGKKEGVVTTATGLQYKVLTSGPADGKSPTNTNTVKVHYEGKLLDGNVFDSSLGGKPIEFGVTGVIAGWTEALKLMKPGDKWELYIPSELAYGEQGMGGDIGPNATLIFQVELLEVK
jgi:FKBP-type peptidyl-prolyl cis-trans isomerase